MRTVRAWRQLVAATAIASVMVAGTAMTATAATTTHSPSVVRVTQATTTPRITYGWSGITPVVYIQYTWSHMWKFKRAFDRGLLEGGPAVCGVVPNRYAAVACGVALAVFMVDVKRNVDYGISHKRCLKLKLPLDPTPLNLKLSYDAYTVKCLS
jgi:hypothetical protein